MSDSVSIKAPAKINLFLRVLSRRRDGFHHIETIFQAIDLCDRVSVRLAGERTELDVEGPEPCPPEENLAFGAAEGFRRYFSLERGVRVRLEKHIPAGAGLGGGSSDAAAVLRCLAALCGIEPSAPALLKLAAELGSDVPFFMGDGALALGRGRGEVLVPLAPLPPRWLVLALPPVHVSTGAAFASLARPTTDDLVIPRALERAPTSWDETARLLVNDFQEVVASAHSSVARSLTALEREGATGASLTGSGAASFGLFGGRAEAEKVAGRLTEEFGWPFVPAETLSELPEPRRLPTEA